MESLTIESLEKELNAALPEMVRWRRYLHRYPELSYEEKQTAAFIADKLSSWKVEVRTGVGGHGVLGMLRGAHPGPTVALRADMDALAIQDEKDCAYASSVKGVMHACGHDGHIAGLLGAARVLASFKEQLHGNVVFLFQPAEEISPGGALGMIADGALDGVDVIYGVHLWTPYRSGLIGTRPGALMSAADEFTVRIKGKGGHGGLPHATVDSIVIGAHLVLHLQSIVSRMIDPLEPCVVSVGMLQAGTGFNIIADSCMLRGTVRTFSPATRQAAEQHIRSLSAAVCSMYGAECELDFKLGYPPVVNDATETARVLQVSERLFGKAEVLECPALTVGEDFSYYLEQIPGCFLLVGARPSDEESAFAHHHPRFDIEESSLLRAATILSSVALDYMEKNRP